MILMQCDCAANAIDRNGNPVCAIHAGLHSGFNKISDNQPDLTGRKAKCAYRKSCNNIIDSNLKLAFFEYKPDEEFDQYYCGCKGWD